MHPQPVRFTSDKAVITQLDHMPERPITAEQLLLNAQLDARWQRKVAIWKLVRGSIFDQMVDIQQRARLTCARLVGLRDPFLDVRMSSEWLQLGRVEGDRLGIKGRPAIKQNSCSLWTHSRNLRNIPLAHFVLCVTDITHSRKLSPKPLMCQRKQVPIDCQARVRLALDLRPWNVAITAIINPAGHA